MPGDPALIWMAICIAALCLGYVCGYRDGASDAVAAAAAKKKEE